MTDRSQPDNGSRSPARAAAAVSRRRKTRRGSGPHPTPADAGRQTELHPLLQLSRTVGNQGVRQLLAGSAPARSGAAADAPPPTVAVQPKLRVGDPADAEEREAEQMAERVTRGMARDTPGAPPAPPDGPPADAPSLRGARTPSAPAPRTSVALPLVQRVLRSGGRPLDPVVRALLEPRFGRDLAPVRVHDDDAAAASARALDARAYTLGRHIVFGSGEYAPGTREGRRLIAHEVTHVAQQGAAPLGPGATAAPAMGRDAGVLRRQQAAQQPQTEEEEESLARRFLEAVLPVGQGFHLGGNLGITPVIPVFISEESQVYIDRRDRGHIHILYRDRGQVNLDVGVGAGVSTGGRQRGNVRAGLGAEAAAQAGTGVDAVVIQEYRIPVGELDDYVINSVGYEVVDTLVGMVLSGGVPPVSTFQQALTLTVRGAASGGDLEPYEIRRKVELGVFAQAEAEITLGLRDVTSRRGAEAYTRSGEGRPGGRPSAGLTPRTRTLPGQEGPTAETAQDVRTRNQMYILNRLLAPSLRLAARLRLAAGYEQTQTEAEGAHTTNLRIYLEGEQTNELPIIGVLPIVGQAGLGAAFNVRVRSTSGEDRITDFIVQVYTKSGELDYYAGSASESTLSFNVGNIFSQEELERLLAGDTSVVASSTDLAERLGRAFEGVQVRRRYQIGGQLMNGFNLFVRRQRGTRVLISDTRTWRDATVGLDVSGYLTVTYSLDGPDTMRVLRLIGGGLAEAGGRAAQTVREGGGVAQVYETLQRYVVEFTAGEQGQELERALLDGVRVSEAEVYFAMGAALGGQLRLRAGGGIRVGGYVEAGMSCRKDFAPDFGGVITLRTFAERIGEVLENPVAHFPECHIVHALLNTLRGRRYEAVGGGATEGVPSPTGGVPGAPQGGGEGEISVAEGAASHGGGTAEESREAGESVVEVPTEAVDRSTVPLERRPPLSTTLRRTGDPDAGTYHLEVVLRRGGRLYRTRGIPMRLVSIDDGSVTVELDSDLPYRLTPEGSEEEIFLLPGSRMTTPLNRVEFR